MPIGTLVKEDKPFGSNLVKFHVGISDQDCEVKWYSHYGLPITSLTLDHWDRDQEMERHDMVKSLTELKDLRKNLRYFELGDEDLYFLIKQGSFPKLAELNMLMNYADLDQTLSATIQ